MPMDYEQYDRWSENARLAREEYVQGKLTAEEFLRKIDTTHELTSYEVDKIDLPDEPSLWQRLVARGFRFDPERYFPEEKAYLNLSDPDPQWQILTADDQRRAAQKGHQSLKENTRNEKTLGIDSRELILSVFIDYSSVKNHGIKYICACVLPLL